MCLKSPKHLKFFKDIIKIKNDLKKNNEKKKKIIHGYGASTKGKANFLK